MRLWKCACGAENRISHEVCHSCQAQMPPSERELIYAETKRLLRPAVQKQNNLRTEKRLKRAERSFMKKRSLFRALQAISAAAVVGALWYTGAYTDILAKFRSIGEAAPDWIGTAQTISGAMTETARETAEEIRQLGQRLLPCLERVRGIPTAVESVLQELPQLQIRHPGKLLEVRESLREIGEHIHAMKESVIHYAEYFIGKYR